MRHSPKKMGVWWWQPRVMCHKSPNMCVSLAKIVADDRTSSPWTLQWRRLLCAQDTLGGECKSLDDNVNLWMRGRRYGSVCIVVDAVVWLSCLLVFLLMAGVATRVDFLAVPEGVRFKVACLSAESLLVLVLLRLEADVLVEGGEAPGARAIKGLGLS